MIIPILFIVLIIVLLFLLTKKHSNKKHSNKEIRIRQGKTFINISKKLAIKKISAASNMVPSSIFGFFNQPFNKQQALMFLRFEDKYNVPDNGKFLIIDGSFQSDHLL